MKRGQLRIYLVSAVFLTLIVFVFIGEVHASDNISNTKKTVEPPVSKVIEKMTLDSTDSPRFTLTDIVWPDTVGEADVCLWHDDKIAAVTLTIDDNKIEDHDWWLSMQAKYPGIKCTWFLIGTPTFSDWDDFQELVDAGNEVQAHDYLYGGMGHGGIRDSSDGVYHDAMLQLRSDIDSNLNNNKCISFAYPFGTNRANAIDDVFISVRGVFGVMNVVNEVNYLDVNSRSAVNDVHDVQVLLDSNETLYNNVYYRGWHSQHYHGISGKEQETEEFLSALHAEKNKLWIGGFGEVSQYGQERDSHTLTVTEVSDTSIKFTLTDEMHDDYFDFPLTVKVRIPNNWLEISTSQDTSNIESKLVLNGIRKYALVKAIPDRGTVIINAIDTISIHVSSINITQDSLNLEVGDSSKLTETISPVNADEKIIGWSSLDNTVATVEQNGLVRAIGGGETYIVVKTLDGGLIDTCKISVSIPVSKVNLHRHELAMITGETFSIRAIISPSNAYNKNVTWKSDNEDIATVDQMGLVTANAIGSANIIVTTENRSLTDTCAVTVGISAINEAYNENSSILNIHPNPSENGIVTVEVSGYKKYETILEILDITGKKVYIEQLVLGETNNKTQLDLSSLKKGIYFVTISNEITTKQNKLIIQ